MNHEERTRLIDHDLKGLWPQWEPTDAELHVWMHELAAFDYSLARRAAQSCFAEQMAHTHRPLPGRFLAQVRILSQRAARGRREPSDVTTDVFLECLEPPEGKPHLAGVRKPVYAQPLTKQSDPDYVAACAESMRKHFNHLYGGGWIVVCTGLHCGIGSDGP